MAAWLAHGAAALARAGVDSPRLDAELLLAEALDADRAALVIEARSPLPADAAERFGALLSRREAREPVAYILGRRHFRNLTLTVDRRALIPRPETELLVEVGATAEAGARVVDVGTGSGAVALALKDERPDLAVTGTDLSADALALAGENARRLGLEISLVRADLLDADRPELLDADRPELLDADRLDPAGYDVVLANLPYVRDDEANRLAPEIAYEPPGALFAGADGLDLIRRLIPLAGAASLVALELAPGQAETVAELLTRAGFPAVTRLRDLAGHVRVLVGRR